MLLVQLCGEGFGCHADLGWEDLLVRSFLRAGGADLPQISWGCAVKASRSAFASSRCRAARGSFSVRASRTRYELHGHLGAVRSRVGLARWCRSIDGLPLRRRSDERLSVGRTRGRPGGSRLPRRVGAMTTNG